MTRQDMKRQTTGFAYIRLQYISIKSLVVLLTFGKKHWRNVTNTHPINSFHIKKFSLAIQIPADEFPFLFSIFFFFFFFFVALTSTFTFNVMLNRT